MNAPEDRAWQEVLERIDLDVSDADLVAAEQQLAAVAAEQAPVVRPEWIEATLAKAKALARAPQPAAAPLRRVGGWRTVQRLAAAVVAFVGLHGTAAAATAAVATVAVVAVTMLWPEGRDSRTTMSYELALQILMEPTAELEERRTAIHETASSVVLSLQALRQVASSGMASGALQAGAAEGFAELARLLSGHPVGSWAPPPATAVDAALQAMVDLAGSDSARSAGLHQVMELAKAGVVAMRSLPGAPASLVIERDRTLAKIRRLHGIGD